MPLSVSIQLTTQCNLDCVHCFVDPSGIDFSLENLKRVIGFVKEFHGSHISFTGGEPTLHPRLPEILELLKRNAFTFSIATNGWNFVSFYRTLPSYLPMLKTIAFSLDGPTETLHDTVRGKGSYRKVLQAISICRSKAIPFGLKTTVMRGNLRYLEETAGLAAKVGAGFLGVLPLMPTPGTAERDLLLDPGDLRKAVEEVSRLQKVYRMKIFLTAGYFERDILFLCPSLTMRQLYITSRGEVSFCCHLADYRGGDRTSDLLGNLGDTSLHELLQRMIDAVAGQMNDKIRRFSQGTFGALDYYPCWYCLKYFQKVGWMADLAGNPWSADLHDHGVPEREADRGARLGR